MRDRISSPRYSSIGGTSSEKAAEDQAADRRNAELARTVILHAEALGHAAFALDAVLEGDADQVAFVS